MTSSVRRREFLRIGSLGLGLGLTDLLRARAHADEAARTSSDAPLAGAGRAKSVLMVYLMGGMSHHDTYDMKPDAPASVRGEFSPIRTRVPGLDVCELLPLQAQIADRFSVVRDLSAWSREHEAMQELITGHPWDAKPRRPAIGCVVSRERSGQGLPPFVNLAVTPGNVTVQHDPSYVGGVHRPLTQWGGMVDDLRINPNLTSPAKLSDRQSLLRDFDRLRQETDARGEMTALDGYQRQAVEMILSGRTRAALDVSQEPENVRARYARFPTFLTARRLLEAGVSFVTVLAPTQGVAFGSWDTHEANFKHLRAALPVYDAAVHTLLTDLHDRGLSRDVLVVFWGEFGRTPVINKDAGRDHWPNANFAVFSGGGLRMGEVVGATTSKGEQPVGRSRNPQNVVATIYHALGIDPDLAIPDLSGRPQHLLDDREPIRELL